jgi:hypothetical protein
MAGIRPLADPRRRGRRHKPVLRVELSSGSNQSAACRRGPRKYAYALLRRANPAIYGLEHDTRTYHTPPRGAASRSVAAENDLGVLHLPVAVRWRSTPEHPKARLGAVMLAWVRPSRAVTADS